MLVKLSKQQYIGIWPEPIHNNDPKNVQIDNTGKKIVALQPKYHYILLQNQF